MNDTDMRLILFCLNLIESNEDEEVILVTEETESSNDNKLFKKIPFICKQLDITKLTLPQLLEKYEDIEFEFK